MVARREVSYGASDVEGDATGTDSKADATTRCDRQNALRVASPLRVAQRAGLGAFCCKLKDFQSMCVPSAFYQ